MRGDASRGVATPCEILPPALPPLPGAGAVRGGAQVSAARLAEIEAEERARLEVRARLEREQRERGGG